MDYNTILQVEIEGVYGDYLATVNKINEYYEIHSGKQEWDTPEDLDYEPTKKITNIIKKLIATKARFMFGNEPYFDIRQIKEDEENSTKYEDEAQEKEDLLYKILKENKFHSKLLKAKKDCSIGGKIAIKLWGHKEKGLKIIFSPAQEFFPQYNLDDVDQLEKVVFLYALNNETNPEDQRIKKQVWELVSGKCMLNETTHDGKGEIISIEYEKYSTGLDFIPVIIVQNGGLTGETEGTSDVSELWSNQKTYNRMTSDDVDALRFQMFGQDVVTDANEDSIKNIKVAPGAMVDLQTDMSQANQGRQANMQRLESGFSYDSKFKDTVDRIKSDMYEAIDVPNVSLEQLKGLMTSGKSMKALYWGLIAACEEDWTEWGPALNQMVDYIFKMVITYNLYKSRDIAKYETTLEIQKNYPIAEDEEDKKELDMQEVNTNVRSRKSYMKKWGEYPDIDAELKQIQLEQQLLQDSFTRSLIEDIEDPIDDDPVEE